MQEYVRLYAEGIIDRLIEEGVSLDDAPLERSDDGTISSYLIDLGQSGEDDLLVFANEFATTHYPNEFSNPTPTRVQILLLNQICKQYKNIGADLAAIFHYDQNNRPRITFRIVGARLYLGDGTVFESPRFSEVLNFASQLDKPDRVVEVGEN